MNSWPFIAEHQSDPIVWVLVTAFLLFLVGLAISKVAQQPYFGGRKHLRTLEEHYIHGEMTTQEYEDRKNHIVTGH